MVFAFRREERARHAAAVLTTADPTRSKFSVLSCLPTAPALPMVTTESFGTFSFYSSSPASYGCPVYLNVVLRRKAQ
jgi:hypothetical protein